MVKLDGLFLVYGKSVSSSKFDKNLCSSVILGYLAYCPTKPFGNHFKTTLMVDFPGLCINKRDARAILNVQ